MLINSILSVGLQPYLEQGHISAMVAGISLIVRILGSIELYMKIQENMEVELVAQKDFYILSISIYKVFQLDDENRNMDMKLFLEETFANYQKLIENSNVVAKKIKDKLTLIDVGGNAGAFTNSSGNIYCQSCPKGSYQENMGSAYCDACPVGKYLNIDGGAEVSLCQDCPIGKYGNTKGLAECLQCPDGQYQDALGASICKSCKDLGKIMTSNADFTGCKVDEALVNEELIVTMFNKGVALSLSFSISTAFVFICGYMQLKRETAQEYIGQISRWQVVFTSALSGFSFGSEVFLIFGIWREAQAIAGFMLVGRLLHPSFLIYILCVMFLSDNMKNMLTSCVPHAKLWGSYLHKDFAREVLPVVAVIIIVCMGDISLVKLLPWKKSVFYTESKGFPSLSLMQLCLGLKTLQSAVSVICQISYLVSNSNLNDPTTSPQAKALFGLNIAVSLTSFVMGLVMLLLKGSLMGSVNGKDAERNDTEIEMSNDIVYTDNPLQNASDSKDTATNLETDSRVYELETENSDLKTENAKKNQENTDLKTENTILQEEIKELKSKYENYTNDKSADL